MVGALCVNPYQIGYLSSSTLTNSEDPDEMSHNVVFHQGGQNVS